MQAMPRYFLHIRTATELIMDPEGELQPDLEAIRSEAIEAAREILEDRDGAEGWHFEICDETGTLLLKVPFAEGRRH